jgi:hypothetical protein
VLEREVRSVIFLRRLRHELSTLQNHSQ